jgi:AcrR family transcriptional regulator
VFADRGFVRGTIRRICDAAGVNVASVKYYFGDKESLYVETVRLARSLRATEHPFPPWDDDTPPEHRLHEFVSALLRRLMVGQTAPWPVRLLTRELMYPTGLCRALVQEHFQPDFERLLGVIDALAPYPLAPDERLKIGFSVIGQCLHYRVATEMVSIMVPPSLGGEFQAESLARHITRFTLAAIRGVEDCADSQFLAEPQAQVAGRRSRTGHLKSDGNSRVRQS